LQLPYQSGARPMWKNLTRLTQQAEDPCHKTKVKFNL
jgi:hypothetical protein